jgi:hypothetical protein
MSNHETQNLGVVENEMWIYVSKFPQFNRKVEKYYLQILEVIALHYDLFIYFLIFSRVPRSNCQFSVKLWATSNPFVLLEDQSLYSS